MAMKGITPVIAVILLLLITVAMVGFAFVWFNRITATASNATQQQLESQLQAQAKRISIDNINSAGAAVTIRNIGSQTVLATDMQIYVSGAAATCSPAMSNIAPGAVTTCDWSAGVCAANVVVRVTAPGNFDESNC